MGALHSTVSKGKNIRKLLAVLIGVITLTAVGLSLVSIRFLADQDTDGAVINIAGRQRMLSQAMAKDSLAIAAGHAVGASKRSLAATRDRFNASLTGLINGSKDMGVPPTTDIKTLAQLQVVAGLWRELEPQVSAIINATPGSDAVSKAVLVVLDKNMMLLQEMNKAVGMYEQLAKRKVGFLRIILVCGALLSLLVAGLSGWIIAIRLVKPLRKVVDMIHQLEDGNLKARCDYNKNDEIGDIAESMDAFAQNLESEVVAAFQKLADGDLTFVATGVIADPLRRTNGSLNDLMGNIQTASEQIAAASNEVSGASQSLSQGATESAASLEEISSSMTEMSSQTKINAENASQANTLSVEAKEVAGKGNSYMAEMVSAMEEINEAGESISKIIKVIDEIAFQTNMLALNAAVEAARAGRHGKGFAVVAEEVRNLAARSAKAARETSDLIASTIEKTDRGAATANHTAEVLGNIISSITKVSDLVGEIAAASSEQAHGISEITVGLKQIDQVTQQNTANAEESAAAAEELSAQAMELKGMLATFTLQESESSSLVAGYGPPLSHQAEAPVRSLPVSPASGGWG